MKISQLLGSAVFASTIAATTAFIAPLAASAASFSFGFQNISGANNTVGDSIVNQFSFSITDAGSGKTQWEFNNSGSVNSFIGQIYFDWHGLSSAPITSTSVFNATGTSAGVSFEAGSGKLPQGQNVVTLLSNTLGFDNSTGNQNANLVLDAADPGSGKSGIDKGETLAVIFNSLSATALRDMILADTLRIGIHVQGIAPTGGSDAYFDGALLPPPTPTKPVPVPGFVLGVMVAGAFGGSRLLKNKKQTA